MNRLQASLSFAALCLAQGCNASVSSPGALGPPPPQTEQNSSTTESDSQIDASPANAPSADNPSPESADDSSPESAENPSAEVPARDVPQQQSPAGRDAKENTKCKQRATSTLPGVSLRVTSGKCHFSLSELFRYVNTPYEIRFEEPVTALKPYAYPEEVLVPWPPFAGQYYFGCGKPSDPSNLIPAAWISGADSSFYCECDTARCSPNTVAPKDVQPGAFKKTFRWIGKNFSGPSDTNEQPKGNFEPGQYELTIRVDGSYLPEGASGRKPFHLQTVFPITITP